MSAAGRFTWYDLMTTDPEAGQAFYTELLGWGTQAWDGPMPYTMWTHAGAPMGGVMQLPEEAQAAGAPPHWIAYVAVDDLAATVARVTELGGAVHVPPTEVPESGAFSVLADPQGAVFAIYKSNTPEQGGAEPGVGRFSWHELATEDFESSLAFYGDVFGWVQGETHDMGPEHGIYQIYGHADGGPPLGGMFNKPAEMPAAWILYVSVEDAGEVAGKVAELGGQVVNGPMEVPGGDLIAQCLDPQGAFFALHSLAKG